MSHAGLEEKIKQLSTDYIYKETVSSLLLLLMSQMEETPLSSYEVHPDILDIKKAVKTHLLSLEDTLDGDASTRQRVLHDCFGLKQQLLSIYETVYSYFSQWNLISTLVSDQIALRKYKEDGLSDEKIEWSLFFADCHAFLENTEPAAEQTYMIGQILKCIPLSVPRDNYYDTLKASLSSAFREESEPMIASSLKTFTGFCFPQGNPLYGKYFPALAEWIGQKQMLLPHKMSDDALFNFHEELQTVYESLGEIEDYFSCILHDINSLILILYLSYTFQELTERSASYSDLYHAVCEYITGEMDETEKMAYADTIMEQLEVAVEPLIDSARDIAKKEHALLQKFDSFTSFSEDIKKLLMTEEFIRDCFFGELNEQLFHFDVLEGVSPASKEVRESLIDAFIQKTRAYFDTLPAPTRKIAMQNLMGSLPSPHSVEEVMELLMDAIDKAGSDEQKILIVDKIGMLFEDYGWTSILDEHTEHHHDCDCGCHHHHH